MTCYRGRTSFKIIERDHPHHVDTVVPPGGLRAKLDAMYEFHNLRGIEAYHGRGHRDEKGRDYVRWCFADPTLAATFASEFKE